MSSLIIRMGSDDAAMVESGRQECVAMLESIVQALKDDRMTGHCVDSNGNRCGEWSYTPSWKEKGGQK